MLRYANFGLPQPVGFGGRAARVPLKIEDGYEVDDGDGAIRILADEVFGYRIQRYHNGVWENQYTVELAPAHKSDILAGNHWTENYEGSHFRHGIGVGLFMPEGRTSFYGGILTHRGADVQCRKVSGTEEVIALLADTFGLKLTLTTEENRRLAAYTQLQDSL